MSVIGLNVIIAVSIFSASLGCYVAAFEFEDERFLVPFGILFICAFVAGIYL